MIFYAKQKFNRLRKQRPDESLLMLGEDAIRAVRESLKE